MKIIKQNWKYESEINPNYVLPLLERAVRTCYKSEDLNPNGDMDITKRLLKSVINRQHESVLEHYSFSVRINTDRATQNQIVRHRLSSYSISSQRYCNFSKDKFGNEITFVLPTWLENEQDIENTLWYKGCLESEAYYFGLVSQGAKPEEARSVLNNSVNSEIFMTSNLRQWKSFLKLRITNHAQPEIRSLARSMLDGFKVTLPIIFEDINYE